MENHIHNRLGNLKSFNNFKQLSERFLAKKYKENFLWFMEMLGDSKNPIFQ